MKTTSSTTSADTLRTVQPGAEVSVLEATGPAEPDQSAEGRQCARCRKLFPVETGTHPMELLGWWTCPQCTRTLLPGRSRAASAADPGARPS